MKRSGVWAAVFFFSLFLAVPGRAQTDHKYDPVVINGSHLPAVMGVMPDQLRLFAFDGKNFRQIVYQIDQRYETSIRWHKGRQRRAMVYALNVGGGVEADPDPKFDADDELAFMSWDLGLKAPEAAGPAGSKACQEIKVTSPDNQESRYTYLCSFDNPPPALSKEYVHIGGDKDSFIGKTYKVSYPKDKPLFFDGLQLGSLNNFSPNLIDCFKFNYEVRAAFAIFLYNVTEDDIRSQTRGLKVGPVRIIKEVITVTEAWPHNFNRLLHHVYYYPYHMEWDMETRAPIVWWNVHTYDLSLSLDMNPVAEGSQFYSEKNPVPVTVDGVTDTEELKLNYGPQRWVAMSTKYGTIYNQLDLPPEAKDLFTDLLYEDMAQKQDPPENIMGMFGKFGFKVRDPQKAGRVPAFYRDIWFFSPDTYQKSAESQFVDMYTKPFKVESDNNLGYAVVQSMPFHEEDRKPDDQPIATLAPRAEKKQQAKMILPNFMIDPYNTGYGGGVSYTDNDLFHSGTGFNIYTMFTTRNFYDIDVTFTKLKIIPKVEDFEFTVGVQQFPSQAFYGIGDTSRLDHEAIYWWNRQLGTISFKKHFADNYGIDTQIFYRNTTIKEGQQPLEGGQRGKPTVQNHYGYQSDVKDNERWGGPLYGLKGGMTNGFNLNFYRDMRDENYVPHRGDYELVSIYHVGPEFLANYDYTRVSFDLRKYWEPSWLQNLPMDSWFSDNQTFAGKLFGPDKHRNFSIRAYGVRTLSEERDYHGQNVLNVPFYELVSMGGSSTNRGLNSNRFVDNDMFLIQAEYRWQYWRFFDIGVFCDTGLVMNDMFDKSSWDGQPWHTSYGASLRAHIPPNLFVSVEYLWGPDFPSGAPNAYGYAF